MAINDKNFFVSFIGRGFDFCGQLIFLASYWGFGEFSYYAYV